MDNKNKQSQDQNTDEVQNNPFKSDELVKEVANTPEIQAEKPQNIFNNEQLEGVAKEKEALAQEFETLKSQYVRLAADFDNFRKRQMQEKQDLARYGAADTVKTLLPVLDNLDRAYDSFQTLEDPAKLKESFNILYRLMQESINKLDVIKIKTVGELFDPNYHEAVMQEETTEFADNAIMQELQCGYMLNERVLRPAMVKVACNPSCPAVPGSFQNKQNPEGENQ